MHSELIIGKLLGEKATTILAWTCWLKHAKYLSILTQQTMGTAKWAALACCIQIDARLSGTATGGREPRIILLAASHVAGGKVLATFHEYIKIDQSADAAAVRGVHGLDFLALQERASDSFKAVGSRWIDWLRTRTGSANAATLVTAGGLKGGVYSVLASELARAGPDAAKSAASLRGGHRGGVLERNAACKLLGVLGLHRAPRQRHCRAQQAVRERRASRRGGLPAADGAA